MKRILLVAVFICSMSSLFAQQGNNAEKIKAIKTAFITTALDLSSKEAQTFWPIYNEYDKQLFKVKVLKTRELAKKIRQSGGIEKLSESEANQIVEEFINIDFEVAKAKQNLRQQLKGVIPSKKIIKLFRAEQDFNKRLLRELRNKRKK